jgi:hypothetical protein
MNNYESSSKILFGIVVVVAVVSVIGYWSSSSVATTTVAGITNTNIQKAMASSGTRTTNIGIVLPSPLYTEVDKTTSQKAVIVNGTTHATEVTFSGHGTTRGLNYTDSGKGLIISRGNNGVINTKGQVDIMSTSNSGGKEKASATFEEIGHSDANGIVTATGAAFFDANATGKLAFLGNIVAVYKDIIYNKNGTDKVVAWEWK